MLKIAMQIIFLVAFSLLLVEADDLPNNQLMEFDYSELIERDYSYLTGNDVEDRHFRASERFSQQCLQAHNSYRNRHGVPPLVLNQQVTAVAQKRANWMAARNSFVHSDNKRYGENLYASWGRNVINGKDAVVAFYAEIKYYNFNAPRFSMATGHFTQVVWKSSKSMGVGLAKGSNGHTYVVVNYYPRGNYQGQLNANVPRPFWK